MRRAYRAYSQCVSLITRQQLGASLQSLPSLSLSLSLSSITHVAHITSATTAAVALGASGGCHRSNSTKQQTMNLLPFTTPSARVTRNTTSGRTYVNASSLVSRTATTTTAIQYCHLGVRCLATNNASISSSMTRLNDPPLHDVGSLDEDGRRVLFSGRSSYNRQIYVVLVDPADVIDYTVDHDDLTFTDITNAPELASSKSSLSLSSTPSLISSSSSSNNKNASTGTNNGNGNGNGMISTNNGTSISVEELASRASPGSLDDEDMQILRTSINNSINSSNTTASSPDDKPIYMLHFGDDMCQTRVQIGSPETLLSPYLYDLMASLIFLEDPNAAIDEKTQQFFIAPEPKRILIMGLGGGAAVNYLRHMYPEAHIDVVEMDDVVIQVARDFFGVPNDDNELTVHHSEATMFIAKQIKTLGVSKDGMYDVIIQDASYCVPSPLLSQSIFFDFLKLLRPGGISMVNLFVRDAGPQLGVLKNMQEVFSHVYTAQTNNNRILVGVGHGSRSVHPLSRDDMIDRAVLAMERGCMTPAVLSHVADYIMPPPSPAPSYHYIPSSSSVSSSSSSSMSSTK